MKKSCLLVVMLLLSYKLMAQTSTLEVLVDSLPGNGFGIIEKLDNKLYTFPAFTGGQVFEVNQNTGALSPVLILPQIVTPLQYSTYSGNFVLLNNKLIAAIHATAGGKSCVIAAGTGTLDTLLSSITPYGSIFRIDSLAYLLFSDSASGVGSKLYSTNLNNPVYLIDSNVNIRPKIGTSKLFYGKNNYPVYNDWAIYSTNGTAKVLVEYINSPNYVMALIGEINGDMYYTVSKRATSMDTTWIKKCSLSGIVTEVDTIITRAFVSDNGLVGLGSKLILPFKREDAPYYQDFIVYDLLTNTYVNVSQNSYSISTYKLEQTQVGTTYFYYNSINPTNRYISDGTIAGTHKYGSQNGGFGTNLEFESYDSYQTLGNKAIICNDFPISGNNDNLQIGVDTGLVKFPIYSVGGSYPSHFNKVGNAIFFTIHNASYSKITLMKMTGCNIPMSNPLLTKNVSIADIQIFPNPTNNGIFTIKGVSSDSKTSYKVFNSLGLEVNFTSKQTSSNSLEIDIEGVSKGIYFATISSNSINTTYKLVVN